MNVPNTLSIVRILLIPVFCVTFLKGAEYYLWAGLSLALSALSDLMDGYFARKLNQITELGKWLDPVADKLTLAAVVVCMWISFHDSYPIVTPIFAVLILKEVMMAIGGLIVIRGSKHMVSAMWWGKVGTAVFYACMLGIVLVNVNDWGGEYQSSLIISLCVIPAVAMIFAFVRYFIVAVRMLKENKANQLAAEAETEDNKKAATAAPSDGAAANSAAAR